MKGELLRIDTALPTREWWDEASERLARLRVSLQELPLAVRFKVETGIPLPSRIITGKR